MERILEAQSRSGESRSGWLKSTAVVVAATAALAACTSEAGGSSSSSRAAEQSVSALASPVKTGDPRAFQCTGQNPYAGTVEECPLVDNGPVFRYDNLSGRERDIAYDTSVPTYVTCRIPEDEMPEGDFSSLNDGGVYVLGGQYNNLAVAPADNFYNPSLPPHETSYDTRVALCSQAAVAAATSPSSISMLFSTPNQQSVVLVA